MAPTRELPAWWDVKLEFYMDLIGPLHLAPLPVLSLGLRLLDSDIRDAIEATCTPVEPVLCLYLIPL